jgi:SSS family transporter
MSTETISTGFGVLNYLTLGLYLVGTLVLGLWFAAGNKTTSDYFKAGKNIPWIVVGISMSNVSSISYMSIPAKAYTSNWTVFFVNLPILLLAPLIIYIFLPLFRQLSTASAYEYLEKRFGIGARIYGAAAFILFQVARMALVIYLPALALAAVTDMNLYACIVVIGVLSAIYSALGGISAVVWTDFAQTVFLLGAAVLAFVLVVWRLDGGFTTLANVAARDDKLHLIDWSGDYTTSALWVVLLGSMFAQLVPYVSDQSIIQRYMTTTDLKSCGRAIWSNAILAIANTLVFLGVGTAIYVYYQFNPQRLAGLPGDDAILPFFIARELPPGVAGLVVAGIFAAAQSAISTSLNSTSTVLVTDFFQRFGSARSDATWLALAKWITAGLGVVAVVLACWLAATGIKSAFDTFQRILGLTASGLGGLFLLGMFTKRATGPAALGGVIASAVALYFVQAHTKVHVYLYSAIGIGVCFAVGYLASFLAPRSKAAAAVEVVR